MKKNILITGASGQLAMEIKQELNGSVSNNYIFKEKTELDVTNIEKLDSFFEKNEIHLVVNCAAYTNVNGSEIDKESANLINHLAVKNIAEVCTKHKAACIHLSTDYVFSGEKNELYIGKQDVYHFSNEGVCSWYDFAIEILKLSGSSCKVIPCLSYEFPTPAARPAYSVLDKSKLKADFNYTIPYWKDSLEFLMKNYHI